MSEDERLREELGAGQSRRQPPGVRQTHPVGGIEDAGADDALRVVGIEAVPASWVDKVIELGDKHRNRLGHMPFSGYKESAMKGQVVLAIRTASEGSETLAGYCLYDPTVRADRYARVVHLCVAEEERGKGIAQLLIDAVMERCADRLGLRLRCRDDWEAAKAWASLGFEPVRRRVGRSKAGDPLTEWWRPNETANLLSLPTEDPDQLLVSVDSNVFCDLYGTSPTRRQRFSGTVAVLAAAEQIRLARPFSLSGELNQTTDQRERDILLQAAAIGGLKVLNGDRAKVRKVRDELLAAVPAEVLAKDESLETDAKLLAESIVSGADVFVTRDAAVVTYFGPLAAGAHDLAVLYPDELPAFIDRRADAASYLPVQLEETQYQVSRGDAATWNPEQLMDLLTKEAGERKVDFRVRIKTTAEESAGETERQIMLTPTGDVLAIWSARPARHALEVQLLRVQRGPLLPTITRQVSRHLRRQAAASILASVRLLDPHTPASVRTELQRDGFAASDQTELKAVVIDIVGPWSKVRAEAEKVAASGLHLPQGTLSRTEAAEFERVWWPAKILDADLATYIVPIRGVFADDLLGHVPTLVARPADLGLSREHVYYRSGQSRPNGPGRILWYSSARDKEIVACSRLVESVTGTPEVLHRAFANLGVWNLHQVRAAIDKRGRVNALRFADTEIFMRPVPLRRVQELSKANAKLTIQSPVQVDSQMFKRLYEEGKPR